MWTFERFVVFLKGILLADTLVYRQTADGVDPPVHDRRDAPVGFFSPLPVSMPAVLSGCPLIHA